MAHRNKVARSLESPCGTRCVDIYWRPDGRFGFAEYRRDPEDPSGWHPTGTVGVAFFAHADDALGAARVQVPWMLETGSR